MIAAPRPTGSTSWARWRPGDPAVERIYADPRQPEHPQRPRRAAVRLLHPRWEFVFQPEYAAYLNLIEPWWKVLRSLALKGRRFETWAEIEQAVNAPPPTGTRTSTPSSGDAGDATATRRLGVAALPAISVIWWMHHLVVHPVNDVELDPFQISAVRSWRLACVCILKCRRTS